MDFPRLTMQLVSAPPVSVGGLRVTPYARVLRLTLPGRTAALVWARPGPVDVAWPSGRTQRVEVRDPTRDVVWGLAVLCAAASLGLWLAGRAPRE